MFSEVPQREMKFAQSEIRPVRHRSLTYEFGSFEVEEHDMRTVWPAGDPVPRDTEILVLLLSREGNPDYEPT